MWYAFLDESGTHKSFGKTAIVLVCVVTQDVEKVSSSILEAEKRLGIDQFHWTEHSWKIRKKFLCEIIGQNFSVRVAIIENPFYQKHYAFALSRLIINDEIHTLVMDGKKSRKYKIQFKKELQKQGAVFGKLVTGNDKSYPILRLADFCAGLSRSYHEDGSNQKTDELYQKLQSKITLAVSN